MKKIALSLALITLSAYTANAVVFQKIVLKNGSVLNGFIQQQDGTGNMTVKTDNAVISLKNLNLNISSEKDVAFSNLSAPWKEWAEANDAFSSNGTEKTLKLRDITVGINPLDTAMEKSMIGFEAKLQKTKRLFKDVCLLENGSYVRFLEMSPNIYEITWDDVVSIKSDKRPKNALSGVDRKYVLSNREISGQYAGETPNTISLYQPDGMVETVDYKDIKKFTFYGINPKQDIFEQSELLDVVRTKSEGDLKGIIIEQDYSGEKDSENFVSIWVKGRSPQMVKISDINAICKEKNDDYHPKYDVILQEGQIMVNRKDVEFVNVKEMNNLLVLDSLKQNQIIEKGKDEKTILALEYHEKDAGSMGDFRLVKLKKTTVKKTDIFGFSYKDVVNSIYHPTSRETSVNHTTRIEFIIQGTGNYAFYDAKTMRAIPIIVK